MRAVLDACVLYPTLLRALLFAAADGGLFEPVWSARILEEWRRAVIRHGGDAGAEIALAQLRGVAEIPAAPDIEARLSLPDPGDRHVLATAIAGRAEALVTLNLRDFPPRALAREGVVPWHPDSFLLALDGPALRELALPLAEGAARVTGLDRRAVLKKARLPRLAKAWESPL